MPLQGRGGTDGGSPSRGSSFSHSHSRGDEGLRKGSQAIVALIPSLSPAKSWAQRENLSLFIFLFTKLGCERVLKTLERDLKKVQGDSPAVYA